MIKIYGMKTCPDCMAVDKQAEGNNRYEVIDIGDHVKYLKEFLYLRDNSPAFAEAREKWYTLLCVRRWYCDPRPRKGWVGE